MQELHLQRRYWAVLPSRDQLRLQPYNLEKVEKSALSLHSYNQHREQFDLSNFRFMLSRQVRARDMDRSEAVSIGEFRTNVMGLNRMNVRK